VLNDPVVFPGRFDHFASFPDIMTARLFHICIFTRLAGPDHRKGVPVVGRGDADHVDILIVHHPAQVLLQHRFFAVSFPELLLPFFQYVHVRVAEYCDRHIVLGHQALYMVIAPAFQPEDRCIDPVIGPEYTCRNDGRGKDCRGTEGGCVLNEGPA
jgi:hypothetical protein